MDVPDACMYSDTLHKLSAWEIEACPWWIDMEKDHVLARERDLRNAQLRDAAPNAIGASFVPPPASGVGRSPTPLIQRGDSFSGIHAVYYSEFTT